MNAPAGQNAEIDWHGGDVPISVQFQDPYFSTSDGLAESEHVFLAGNGLPGRFRPGFRIAELGFGTGLNALAAARFWRAAGVEGALRYTAFEAWPMRADDMARALDLWPQLAADAAQLIENWSRGARRIALPGLDLEIIDGDARDTLPLWTGRADAWFLDGFAPARNPELWENGLIRSVAAHTAPDGTVATYTAAGAVRRGLADAGFQVTRIAGFGRKRHMTSGALRP